MISIEGDEQEKEFLVPVKCDESTSVVGSLLTRQRAANNVIIVQREEGLSGSRVSIGNRGDHEKPEGGPGTPSL